MKKKFTEFDASLYIDNELDSDEVKAFEEAMKNDPKLAEHVRAFRKLSKVTKEDLANIKLLVPVFKILKLKNISKTTWVTALAASLVIYLGIQLALPPESFNWQPAVSYSIQYRNTSEPIPPHLLGNEDIREILAPALEQLVHQKIDDASGLKKLQLKRHFYKRPIRIGVLEPSNNNIIIIVELFNNNSKEWEKIGNIQEYYDLEHFKSKAENYARDIVDELTLNP